MNRILTASALCLTLLGTSQGAFAYTVSFGADLASSTTNSDAAFAEWQGLVAGYTLDTMDGLSGTPAGGTTALGNTFTARGGLGIFNANVGVIDGTALSVDRRIGGSPFTWNLVRPANGFGIFGHDNDGGTVSITFVDGSSVTEQFQAASSSSDNMFWGISGLSSLVASVTINTTDPGGVSIWDNAVTAVPVPAALPLFGSALVGLGLIGRRRKRA